MSAVITNFPEVRAKLIALPPALRSPVRKALAKVAEEIVSEAKRSYLSGPRPSRLDVVTGRLRNSITRHVTDDGRDMVAKIGTNVPYARRHEVGFRGIETVRAHTRVLGFTDARGREFGFGKQRREIKDRAGQLVGYRRSSKTAAGLVDSVQTRVQFVRAHTRRANTRERAFLRRPIRDHEEDLRRDVLAALREAVRQQGGAR